MVVNIFTSVELVFVFNTIASSRIVAHPILIGLSRRMGKAKRAHLYPMMGTGACPLPILRAGKVILKALLSKAFKITFPSGTKKWGLASLKGVLAFQVVVSRNHH